MCPECTGLGTRLEMDPALVVPNRDLSVTRARSKPVGAVGRGDSWGSVFMRALERELGIDLDGPWRSSPEEHRHLMLYGTGDERVDVKYHGWKDTGRFRRYEGAINTMMRRMRETKSEVMRDYYQQYLSSRRAGPAAGGGCARGARASVGGKRDRRGDRDVGRRRRTPSATRSRSKGARP